MTASEERFRLKELKSGLLKFSGFESSSPPRLISSNSHHSVANLVGDLGTSFISASAQSSPSSVLLCRTRSRHGQRITPFVIRLPGVSSDVHPRHLVVAGQLLELLPQIPIHHFPWSLANRWPSTSEGTR